MLFIKLLFGSPKRVEQSAAYTKLLTSRKFSVEYNREEALLSQFEDKVLRR